MNEKKINLVLKGINLLIINSRTIDSDFRRDFNKDFVNIAYPQKKESLPNKTENALRGK